MPILWRRNVKMRIAGFLDKKQVPNVSSAKRNPASQAAEAMMARAPPSRDPWKKSPTIPSKRWTRTVPASSKRVNWKYFWKGKFAHSLLGTRNRYWKGPKTCMSSLSHPIDRNPYRGKREMTEHFVAAVDTNPRLPSFQGRFVFVSNRFRSSLVPTGPANPACSNS